MPKKRDKWPPQITVPKAIRIVTSIYNSYGKSVNADLVAPILECSRRSSNFSKRLSNLADFGLVTYGKDIVSLTLLAQRIAAPVSVIERNNSILDAFNNNDLLQSLNSRFPGGHLPSRENVQNLLTREYDVQKETAGVWCDFVFESFEIMPDVNRDQGPQEIPVKQMETEAVSPAPSRVVTPTDVITIQLKKGENRAITIPNDLTQDELQWFLKWFELWNERPQ